MCVSSSKELAAPTACLRFSETQACLCSPVAFVGQGMGTHRRPHDDAPGKPLPAPVMHLPGNPPQKGVLTSEPQFPPLSGCVTVPLKAAGRLDGVTHATHTKCSIHSTQLA